MFSRTQAARMSDGKALSGVLPGQELTRNPLTGGEHRRMSYLGADIPSLSSQRLGAGT